MNLIILPLTALPLTLSVALIVNFLADFLTVTFLSVNVVFVTGFTGATGLLIVTLPVFVNEEYLSDTHTAVALNVYEQYASAFGRDVPTIIASTASPYKFAPAVLGAIAQDKVSEDEFDMLAALNSVSGMEIPSPLAGLKGKEVRFDRVCDGCEMKETVLDMLGIAE